MGGYEAGPLDPVEPTVKYHSWAVDALTAYPEAGRGTVAGGEFDWGGRLLKGNGGAQGFPQRGWKSRSECNGIRELDCETYKSSRDESRA